MFINKKTSFLFYIDMIVINSVTCFGMEKNNPHEVVAEVFIFKKQEVISETCLPHPQSGQTCLFEYIFYIRIFNSYIVFFHHFMDCFIHEFRIKGFCFRGDFF